MDCAVMSGSMRFVGRDPVIRGRSLLATERRMHEHVLRNEAALYKYPCLSDKLKEYYDSYVKIPAEKMSNASQVVENIKRCILDYFSRCQSQFNITEMKGTGSCREGLKVINPDEYDVMVSVRLDGMSWAVVPSDHPNFFEVRKTGRASSPYDEYLTGGCICPNRLRYSFQGKIQRAVNNLRMYKIALETHGPAITVKVCYGEGKTVHIDFVPSVEVNKKIVVPKPYKHDRLVKEHAPPNMDTGAESRLWRQSFSDEEYAFLSGRLPPSCCHLEVLKIFKAIRLNFQSQFGMFSSYVYKTVLMHMIWDKSDKTQWGQNYLEERFIEFLETLQGYLSKRHLPHFYKPEINLLEDFSPNSCDNLAGYIDHRLGEKELVKMLERRMYSGIP